MRRLLGLTVLVFALAGVYAVTGPLAAPGPSTAPSSSTSSTGAFGYTTTWVAGQAPTITEFQGTPPAASATPDSESECSTLMNPPNKENSTTIDEVASTTCTDDVYYVSGTDQLWRGLTNSKLIGSDFENQDANYDAWLVEGACSSSTWAYWANLPVLHACSDVNGCINAGPYSSPIHYWTC